MTDARSSPVTKEALHYLSAIKVRLELLYEHSKQDARLLEHLSDEVDWIDAEIDRLRTPSVAQEASGCGDPSCKDPTCVYGRGGPYQVTLCDDGGWMVHDIGDVLCVAAQGDSEQKARAICAAMNAKPASHSVPSASRPVQAQQLPVSTLEEAARRLVNELTAQHIQRDKFFVGIGDAELHAYVQLPKVDCRADRIGGWPVIWHFNVGPAEAYSVPSTEGK